MAWLKRTNWIIAIVLCLGFAAIFHFGYPNINDGDSFYHIRHAAEYRTNGITDSSFPWTQFSAIKQYGADIWYGYHILLIPFTYIKDLMIGSRLAGLILTGGALLLYFFILKKLNTRYPLLWTFLMAFSSADVWYRITMVRPHTLTFIMSMLFLYGLVERKWLITAGTAFIIVWTHLALAWVLPLIAGTVFVIQLLHRERINWLQYLGIIGGAAVGWALRPNPLGALKLAYIQVVQLMLEKQQGIPLRFGAELKPIDGSIVAGQLIPILLFILVSIAIFIFLWTKKEIPTVSSQRVFLWSTLLLSSGYFILSIVVARRSLDMWAGFAILFISSVYTIYVKRYEENKLLAGSIVGALGILMAVNSFLLSDTYRSQAIPPEKFKAVSEWLQTNSKPQDLVINLHWDNFGMLYFWNPSNYYVNGMDPIFAYAYDQEQYWKIFYPETNQLVIVENEIYTCPKILCSGEGFVKFYDVLKKDFAAKYILVEHQRHPKLKTQLDIMPAFKDVFHTETETVYQIL